MKVHAICISAQRGTLKQEVPSAVFVAQSGIQGDGHSGDWGRQVTCLRWESVLESKMCIRDRNPAGSQKKTPDPADLPWGSFPSLLDRILIRGIS